MPEAQEPKTPIKAEIATVSKTDMFAGWLKYIENPSSLFDSSMTSLAKFTVYERMQQDGHISALLQTRNLSVQGLEWDVHPHKKGQQRDADFVYEVLDGILTMKAIDELLQAVPVGLQVSEIMWENDGSNIVATELKGRRPERFRFDNDGNLRLIVTGNPQGEALPSHKFAIHRYRAINDGPYGWGVLNQCYWPWWFTKNGVKFWAVFIEKFATPTTVGKYPASASQTDKDNLKRAIMSIQQETGIIIPEGMVIELLEAERTGSIDSYKSFCDFMDARCSKAVLGQTLSTDQAKAGGGGYALGQVHADIKDDIVWADAKSLASSINETIIAPLCRFNLIEYPPYMAYAIGGKEDLSALSERDYRLWQMGYTFSEEYISETYGVPVAAKGQKALAGPAATLPAAAPIPDAGGTPALPANKKPAAEFSIPDPADMSNPFNVEVSNLERWNFIIDDARSDLADAHAETRGVIRAALKSAGDFKAAAAAIGKLAIPDAFTNFMKKEWLRGEIAGRGAALKVVETQGFRLQTSDFSKTKDKRQKTNHRSKETRKNTDGTPLAAEFAEVPIQDAQYLDPFSELQPEEAMAWWDAVMVAGAGSYAAAVLEAGRQAFTIAGLENEYLTKAIKDEIAAALSDGMTYQEFYSRVDDMFDRLGITRLNPYHLENVVRTNMMSAYNRGHAAFDNTQEIAAAFPYFQLTGVRDSNTRPEHAKLIGLVISRDNPFAKYIAPYDYQCRCGRIPLTELAAKRIGIHTAAITWVPPFARAA